jgi:hypothetical protein
MRRIVLLPLALVVLALATCAHAVAVHACISSGGHLYEITSDSNGGGSGTTLKRYNSDGSVLDVNQYAAFQGAPQGTSNWDEGAAFAATMQTRNVWLYASQTPSATWVVNGGDATLTFNSASEGSFAFTTANCVPPPPTRRACGSFGGIFYDIRSVVNGGGSDTTMKRFNADGSLKDVNQYAAFQGPPQGTSNWDEGVAFAATMQTRNAWMYSSQTPSATWVQNAPGVYTWTFNSASEGSFAFGTNACPA